jgi:hypothetical protein
MKCLSVAQPWAWAIIFGGKWIENRNWKTDYRGRLAVHASRNRNFGGFAWRDVPGWSPPLDTLDYGCVIGFVELHHKTGNQPAPTRRHASPSHPLRVRRQLLELSLVPDCIHRRGCPSAVD